MANYRIKHITRYSYASTVIDCANHIMLYPIRDDHQVVKKHELIITQQPLVETFTDYFGNTIGIFSIIQPVNEIIIESNIEVETKPFIPDVHALSIHEEWDMLVQMKHQFPYFDFLTNQRADMLDVISNEVGKLADYAIRPIDVAQRLSRYVFEHFEYDKSVTNVETRIDEVWNMKAGVCQDFAHILLVMLRMTGIPARYVSGYICPKNHEFRGEGATHAWVEVCIPVLGWIGLDPTNNCVVSDRHVRLAVGRNFTDCTPVKGTYKGSSEHTLEVSVRIDNEQLVAESVQQEPPVVFSYQSKNPSANNNSYRKFMEIQQQQ